MMRYLRAALVAATATIPVASIPSAASAALYCEPPTTLICWGGYSCHCGTYRVIELEGQKVMVLPDIKKLKPVKVDDGMLEAVKKATPRLK